MHFGYVGIRDRFYGRVHGELRKPYVARSHAEIRACDEAYRAAATLVGIVEIVLSFNVHFVENGFDYGRGFAVRGIVDVMLYHDAFAHIDALFNVHFFGEGRVQGVGVVDGQYKAFFTR